MSRGGLTRIALPFVVVISIVALLTGCGNPPYPRGTLESLFPNDPKPQFSVVPLQGRLLSVASVASATAAAQSPMLLFLHGSPGDWKAWSYFLRDQQLASYGQRLAVDRPGFGASQPGAIMPGLRQQAALLAAFIPPGRKAIVVGHSLGGPLAAWLAIDFPDKVCAAVSIAGSLSSRYEAPRWYNHLAEWTVVQWALPKEMVWSNREMMPLSAQLQELETMWSQLRVPLVLLQGGKDSLVDPRTVNEVQALAPKSHLKVLVYPDESHFLLWEKPQLVVDAIRAVPCV
jgi:pimeloyl-ACP methyl ester carboxylesterase